MPGARTKKEPALKGQVLFGKLKEKII